MWISSVCQCMSEFTCCPKLPDVTLFSTSKDYDQPEHTRSLIRAFARRLSIL